MGYWAFHNEITRKTVPSTWLNIALSMLNSYYIWHVSENPTYHLHKLWEAALTAGMTVFNFVNHTRQKYMDRILQPCIWACVATLCKHIVAPGFCGTCKYAVRWVTLLSHKQSPKDTVFTKKQRSTSIFQIVFAKFYSTQCRNYYCF